MIRWLPRFTFGVTVWEPGLPLGQWNHSMPTKGIGRVTATGIPGVTFQNRQQLLIVPVRFYEAELSDFRALLEWGQSKAPFLWLPDVTQSDLETQVILAAPRVGEIVTPEPDGAYPRVLVQSLTFRQLVLGEES